MRALLRAGRVLLAAQAVTGAVLLAREAGWLQPAELAFYDAAIRTRAGTEPSRRIAVVIAGEDDIQRFGWPLPDGVLASLAARLLEAGAEAVAFDMYRDKPVGEGGAALTALLQREERIIWAYRLGDGGQPGIQPPAALANTPRAAFADVAVDPGEVVRRGLIAATDPAQGHTVLSLGTALATLLGGERLRPDGDGLRFGKGRLAILDSPFGPYSAVDAAGYQVLLSFRGSFPVMTVADVMDGRASAVARRGVLAGINTLSVRDSFTTPLTTGLAREAPMAGVLVHAHAAEQLLQTAAGRVGVPTPSGRLAESMMVWAAATLGGLVPLAAPAAAWAAAAAIACTALLALVAALAALGFAAGWLLPAVPMLLAAAGATVAAAWVLHGVGHRQRQRLRRAFEHYLDPGLVHAMVSADTLPSLGGEHRVVTAMFTDIEGFTTMAERLPPGQLATALNRYFEGLGQAVMAQGGLIVDFIGDAMFALFGAPVAQPDHAERAVAAALAADRFARAFVDSLARDGVAFGSTRIGVHTGPAIVGNMGTAARLKYSAVGDTMNIAARLESLNRWTGTAILVSDATAAEDRRHHFGLLGEVAVTGRTGQIAIYAPAEDPGSPGAGPDPYKAALDAIRAGNAAEARALWDKLAQARPDDPVAAFHRRRLAAGICTLAIIPGGK